MKGCNNHKKCARERRWMFGLTASVTQTLYSTVMGSEVPKEMMDAAVGDLNMSLKVLEEMFLQGKPFIAGDKISVADLVALEEIMQVNWSWK